LDLAAFEPPPLISLPGVSMTRAVPGRLTCIGLPVFMCDSRDHLGFQDIPA
jgi:hypothetical protein